MFVSSAQCAQLTETPDPYFNQPVRPRSAQDPNSQNLIQSNLVTGNSKIEVSNIAGSEVGGSLWNAPRTPVAGSINNNNPIAPRAIQTPNSLTETFAAPGRQPNSIIRQQPITPSAGLNNPPIGNSIKGSGSLDGSGSLSGSNSFSGNTSNDNSFSPIQVQPLNVNKTPFIGRSFKSPVSEFSGNQTTKPVGFESAVGGELKRGGRSLSQTPTPQATRTPVRFDAPAAPQEKVVNREYDKSFEPGKVLAIVGGQPIFVGDVLFDINQRIEKVMGQAPESVKADARKQLIPKILPQFVDAKIRFVGGLRGLPEEVELDDILEQAGQGFDENALGEMIERSGVKSVAELDAQLRVQGSSVRKIRRMWCEDQLTRHLMQKQLNIDQDIPHQEMLSEYRKNIDSYAIPAKSKWEQLMIRFDKTNSRVEAQKMIDELGNQVHYGASFEAVAKKRSHGFLASTGGQHPETTRGALVLKEIDEAIFTLPIGELSDVIETRDGFHIIRVIERNEATQTPFLEAQVEIKKRLLTDKRNAAFKAHMDKLRREIPVEYFVDDVTAP